MGRAVKLVLAILFFSFFIPAIGAYAQAPLEKAPDIKGRVWFNTGTSSKMSMKALRGKVVLVFFWTANDTSCEMAIPPLNIWYSRYKEKGFEIIGVYADSWGFDMSEGAALDKIQSTGVKFPVVMDEDSAIGSNFKHAAWPAFFLVDRKGYIRGQYFAVLHQHDIETMIKILVDEGESEFLSR